MESVTPTIEQSQALQIAFDILNYSLFDNTLPNCLITLSARGKSNGYFAPKRWNKAADDSHEIALNAELLGQQQLIFEVLARQMVSLWQHEHGKPMRPDYCNTEWAIKMEEIGLIPSDTGQPGGKKTGFRVQHYVDPNGRFKQLMMNIPEDAFPWKTVMTGHRKAAKQTRVKYVCRRCDNNVRGVSGLKMMCHTHDCNSWLVPEGSSLEVESPLSELAF